LGKRLGKADLRPDPVHGRVERVVVTSTSEVYGTAQYVPIDEAHPQLPINPYGVALLSERARAFWSRVKQGFTILRDRRRYLREVFAVQFGGWLFRFAAFWALLEAFNVGGSVKNVLLVLGVNAVSAAVPFTPQGAGVQQALLAKVFAGTAAGATVAAYSVGQQIAIGLLTFGIGFASLALIFRLRSFKEVIRRGREDRAAEKDDRTQRAARYRSPRAPRAPR